MITFEPGQTELEYEMEIVDDDEWEPDEEFYVKVDDYDDDDDVGDNDDGGDDDGDYDDDDDDDEWEPDEEFYVKVSFGNTAQSPVMIMTMHTYPETEKKVLSKNSFGAS